MDAQTSPQAIPEGGSTEEPVFEASVGNAGLVLAGPFLPRLFSLLGLVDADMSLGDVHRSKALHVLHWLAMGRDAADGHDFRLERVLCGAPHKWKHQDGIRLDAGERAICEDLVVAGIIRNWKALGSTSSQALRESFLERNGILRMRNDEWMLQVAPRSFDVLINVIPWNFSMIRHPWMEAPLWTEWEHDGR